MVPLPEPSRRAAPRPGTTRDPEPSDFPLFIRGLLIDTMDRDIARLRNLADRTPSPRSLRGIAAMLHRIQGAAAIMRWRSMAALVERARKRMATGDDDGIALLIAFWRHRRRMWIPDIARPSTGEDDRRERSFRPTPDS